MKVVFSAELLNALPIYLGISRNKFIEQYNLKYTKGYISRLVKGDKPLTDEFQAELNRIWNDELGLTFENLEEIYQLIKTINSNHK